jgi:hypothetical protein
MAKPDEVWDEEKEDYASLADEMNDPGCDPWDESHWDASAVKNAKAYAQKNGLRWPPGLGDYDRFYERENNSR